MKIENEWSANRYTKNAKTLFVILLCIGLSPMIEITHGQTSTIGNAVHSYNDLHSNFINNCKELSEHQPEQPTLTSVFSSQPASYPQDNLISSSKPLVDDIHMTGPYSREQVQDLDALNTNKQRTIVYDEVQNTDAKSNGNSMSVSINKIDDNDSMGIGNNNLDHIIEDKVDNGLKANSHITSGRLDPQRSRINYLDIDVSGISVRAINTAKDGSATATSNIVIKPIQIISALSEASEKLK